MADRETIETVRVWAEHATGPFQGSPRSSDVERALQTTIKSAFDTGLVVMPGMRGVEFGYLWDSKNNISVFVAPDDDLTEEMLIFKVGQWQEQ